MMYIEKDGAKDTHQAQVSAYWHALVDMGFTMHDKYAILYLPMNAVRDREVTASVQECVPLPKDELWANMEERAKAVQDYINEYSRTKNIQNDKLSLEMPRVQKYYWNSKSNCFEVKLVPAWQTAYCPYPEPLCACKNQGTTKIGEWLPLDGMAVFVPRKGYEVEQAVRPTNAELKQRFGLEVENV
jgi:hypothetical protein